jgi:3-oxoadipate enol-lactonase
VSRLPGLTGIIDWSDTNDRGKNVIVLIHSLGTDRTIWATQVEVLAAAGWRVIAVDLPGHGLSTANPSDYTLEMLGRDVMEVTEVCGAEECAVAGVSLGGLVALWLAVNAPERVAALVASNTAARLGSSAGWSDRIAAVESGGMESIRAVMTRFFAPQFAEDHPEELAHFEEVFLATDPVGYTGCCAALRDADLGGRVGSITCPTLVVGGELDVAAPPDLAARLHEEIPLSRLHIIEGSAHISNVDRPAEFNALLVDFLLNRPPEGP